MNKFLSLAAMAALVACSQGYVIEGVVDPSMGDAEAMLQVGGEVISNLAVSGDSFRMSGRVKSPCLAILCLAPDEGNVASMELVLEKGTIKADFTRQALMYNQIQTVPAPGGTPLNDALTAHNDAYQQSFADFRNAIEPVVDSDLPDEVKFPLRDSIFTSYCQRCDKINEDFFQENKGNILGAIAVLNLNTGEDRFESLLAECIPEVASYPGIVEARARYDALRKVAPGQMFTDFTVPTGSADGSPVSLSDYVGKGKYMLVDFWASWCGPCCAEIPNLVDVYTRFAGDKFGILGVAVNDERENTIAKIQELGIVWPVIFESGSIAVDAYSIQGIPQIILFGPDGTIVASGLRGERIGEFLANLFGE